MYLKPLRSSNIISQSDIKTIFSDIEIIYNANVKFLKDLDKKIAAWSPFQSIGDVFLEIVKAFVHS